MSASFIAIELSRIVINERSPDQLIYLREVEGDRSLSLVVGMFEADAIYRVVQDVEMSRPLTHDLLLDVIDVLDGELEQVSIDAVREGTFHAKITIAKGETRHEIDARASDAIAIALKRSVPMVCESKVLDLVAIKRES